MQLLHLGSGLVVAAHEVLNSECAADTDGDADQDDADDLGLVAFRPERRVGIEPGLQLVERVGVFIEDFPLPIEFLLQLRELLSGEQHGRCRLRGDNRLTVGLDELTGLNLLLGIHFGGVFPG